MKRHLPIRSLSLLFVAWITACPGCATSGSKVAFDAGRDASLSDASIDAPSDTGSMDAAAEVDATDATLVDSDALDSGAPDGAPDGASSDASADARLDSSNAVDAGFDASSDASWPSDAGADSGTSPIVCADLPSTPPTRTCGAEQSYPVIPGQGFTKGGQQAFFHDQGHQYGFFHTYDQLVACSGAAARKVHIFLPRDYESNQAASYPVLYMNDGQTAFFTDNAFGVTWDVGNVLSELKRCGEVRDMIVVAPHPLDRYAEYTHEPWLDGRSCCGAPQYATYITQCLRSFVETNYRVATGPQNTAILGSSHGGLSAFWTAAAYPSVFGHVAAMSPSFWVNLDNRATGEVSSTSLLASSLWTHTQMGFARTQAVRPNLWIDWGMVRTGGDHNAIIEKLAAHRGAELVNDLQQNLGYDASRLRCVQDQDGGHTETSWRARLPWVLRWIFPPS